MSTRARESTVSGAIVTVWLRITCEARTAYALGMADADVDRAGTQLAGAQTNGARVDPSESRIERVGERMGVREEAHPQGWFTRLAKHYFARNFAKHRAQPEVVLKGNVSATDRARRAIFWACVKSAVTGALSGSASTG